MKNSTNFDFISGDPTPHSGLPPHATWEKGDIIRVIAGKNRGQKAKIVDNNITSYTLDQPFPIDNTSIVIIEAAGWEYSADSSSVSNALYSNPSNIQIPSTNALGNHIDIALLVGGFVVDWVPGLAEIECVQVRHDAHTNKPIAQPKSKPSNRHCAGCSSNHWSSW
jgi:hypothetical protein